MFAMTWSKNHVLLGRATHYSGNSPYLLGYFISLPGDSLPTDSLMRGQNGPLIQVATLPP